MSNELDPDQDRQYVGPDLGPNCLQKLSAGDTSRQKVIITHVGQDQKFGMSLHLVPTLCMRAEKLLASLCICAGWPEPWLHYNSLVLPVAHTLILLHTFDGPFGLTSIVTHFILKPILTLKIRSRSTKSVIKAQSE